MKVLETYLFKRINSKSKDSKLLWEREYMLFNFASLVFSTVPDNFFLVEPLINGEPFNQPLISQFNNITVLIYCNNL